MSDISNNNNMLPKNHLMVFLQEDGIKLDSDSIRRAQNDDGPTLNEIGFEYYMDKKDYSKAMSWYRLAAKQDDLDAQINIGILYFSGLGVPQDCFTGMEYFLKVAVHNYNIAMDYIGHCFLHGLCAPLDKYKALEWFSKSGNAPEQVEELNKKDVYLRKEDKDKTIHQLAIETKNIMREERRKRNEELQDLEAKPFSEKEIKKLENELEQSHHQTTLFEKEKQENIIERERSRHVIHNLQQQLTDKTDIITSLKQEAKLYQILLQVKSDDFNQFKKINQIERENLKLMRKVREHQGQLYA